MKIPYASDESPMTTTRAVSVRSLNMARSPSTHSRQIRFHGASAVAWAITVRVIASDERDEGSRYEVGGAVGEHDAGQAQQAEQGAAERRGDQQRQIRAERGEGIGRDQLAFPDEAREQGAVGGGEELGDGRLGCGHDVDRPQPVARLDREQEREESRARHVGDDHDAPTVPAIYEHAGHRAKEDGGDRFGDEHGPRRQRRAGARIHVEGQRDDEHSTTDGGGQAADPQQGEVALA